MEALPETSSNSGARLSAMDPKRITAGPGERIGAGSTNFVVWSCLALLLLLYPLSYGPVAARYDVAPLFDGDGCLIWEAYHTNSRLKYEKIRWIYYPVTSVAQKWPLAGRITQKWLELWGVSTLTKQKLSESLHRSSG